MPNLKDIKTRIEVIARRDAFERDAPAFLDAWADEDAAIRGRILAARTILPQVITPPSVLERCAELCLALGSDGLRGELTLLKAGRALAAWRGQKRMNESHIADVAPMALRHRLRRDPLDEAGSDTRVTRVVEEVLGA